MTTKMAFRDAFESVPVELLEDVRSKLLLLSEVLFKFPRAHGTWARLFFLGAYVSLKPSSIWDLLQHMKEFMDLEQDDEVLRAADAAQRALFAVVDHVREHVS